jgi:L-iditol 2-dehydrogenase
MSERRALVNETGTMQAAFFAGPDSIEVREAPVPRPGPGEVLLDVRACGICGSDLHQFAGRWEQPPFIPGHEIAGEIIGLGDGVADWAVGDRVTVEPFLYCGSCRYCRAGRYYQCPDMGFLTLTAHGGFAERVTCPAYTLCRLPDHVDFVTGALVEPLAVGVHAVRTVGVDATDDVLVLGAGAIGLMTAAAAQACGAHQVAITARHAHQAEAARRLGIGAVLSPEATALREQVAAFFPFGPSAVFETVGSAHGTFQQAVDLAGKLARVALLGGNTGPVERFDFSPVPTKELTIVAPLAYAQLGLQRDFSVATDLLAQDPGRYAHLVTHRFTLADIQNAFALASDKGSSGALKVVMVR